MQAIVVNSGIANSCTGKQGEKMLLKCNNWPQINYKFNRICWCRIYWCYWKGDANVYSKEWLFQTS